VVKFPLPELPVPRQPGGKYACRKPEEMPGPTHSTQNYKQRRQSPAIIRGYSNRNNQRQQLSPEKADCQQVAY
jgi:hypothetical protein